MVIFKKKLKKYNEIQLTKNNVDLNNRKMTNHPPSPGEVYEDNNEPKGTITGVRHSRHNVNTVTLITIHQNML